MAFLLLSMGNDALVRYSLAWAAILLFLCFALSFSWHRDRWGWNLLLDVNCLFCVANFVVFSLEALLRCSMSGPDGAMFNEIGALD